MYDIIETKQKYDKVYIKVLFDGNKDKNYPVFPIKSEVERFGGSTIKENDKVGYIDENLNITIPIVYDFINELEVKNDSLKNVAGEKFDPDYSNYVTIRNDKGVGIANKQGEIIVDCQYEIIGYYGENTFIVNKIVDGNWKMGVIDINNNVVIDFVDGFLEYQYFQSGLYTTFKVKGEHYRKDNFDYSYGIIDRDFNVIIPAIYSKISQNSFDRGEYHETFFIVEKDNKRAVIGVENDVKIDFCEKSIYELREEYEAILREKIPNDSKYVLY